MGSTPGRAFLKDTEFAGEQIDKELRQLLNVGDGARVQPAPGSEQ